MRKKRYILGVQEISLFLGIPRSNCFTICSILDHLQNFFDRKSRKKQAKLRNKESVLLCTELEDYIKTKWEPYVLHKISSRNNRGHQNLDILAREIQSHFQEAEKQIEVINLLFRIVRIVGN